MLNSLDWWSRTQKAIAALKDSGACTDVLRNVEEITGCGGVRPVDTSIPTAQEALRSCLAVDID
eukprot:scaffold1146_cov399-Prasinococcus_capsulatus_cf.AAC.26